MLLLGKIFLKKKMEKNVVFQTGFFPMKNGENPVYFLQKMQVPGEWKTSSLMFQRIT